jgi:hypothetical protein
VSKKNKSETRASEPRAEAGLKEAAVPHTCAEPGAARTNQFAEDQGWIDFRDQCRRQMQRPMALRLKYGFCRMYKPVLDDAPWRAFKTMAEYRAWCEKNLPDYLGFKRPVK